MMLSRLAGLAGVVLLLGVAGCGPSHRAAPSGPAPPPVAAPSSSLLPPRPAELRLDGVDPCSLLTPAEQDQLDIHALPEERDFDQPGTTNCAWATNKSGSGTQWLTSALVNQGADYAFHNGVPVQIVQVDGFGAVQTYSPGEDPNTECFLVVDVAQGQSLLVQYEAGTSPHSNHQVACQQDSKVAELLIQNLRARTGG